MKNLKKKPRVITQLQITAGRISELLNRGLEKKEWGMVAKLMETYDIRIINDVLSIYEDRDNKLSLKSIPQLFNIVKQSSAIDAFDIEDLREAIVETREFQKRGKELLQKLLKE